MTSGNAIPGSKRAVMSGRNGVHEGTLPTRKGGGNWGRKDFDWTSMTMNRRSTASSRGGRLFRIPGEQGRWRTTPPAVLSHLFGLLRHRPGLALRHQFLQVGHLALGRSGVLRHDSAFEGRSRVVIDDAKGHGERAEGQDRKSGVEGTRVSGRVDRGGGGSSQEKKR